MISRPSPHRADRRSGFTLIVILWILAGLTALAIGFSHGQATFYREVENRCAGVQARLAAETLLDALERRLAAAEPARRLVVANDLAEAVVVGEATVWMVGRSPDGGLTIEPVYGCTDEAAKLNLNTATADMLAALPGMTPERAEAIVAWRRPAAADAPADGKGGPFETVEELLWVEGFDAETLWGPDANGNGAADAFETDASVGAAWGLTDYVTIYSNEPNRRADGSARIDVNGDETTLRDLLRERFGDARGNEIADRWRAAGRTFGSPLEAAKIAGLTVEEFAQVADDLTADEASTRPGLINVNTAPAAVLACVPGLGADLAARLVARRGQGVEPEPTLAWLLDELDEAACAAAGPHLTARVTQVSADAVARGPNGRGYARVRVVSDFSGAEPRRLYRRELPHLGAAVGESEGGTIR